jgi:ATP-dependent HslUV protease ATP-binding subunit HslU
MTKGNLLDPQEIVNFLNKHIVGQLEAKKSVAVAFVAKNLRKKVKTAIKDEISPKNILMIGPTGVGKTEIARRLAKLSNAPFIKVEATKYTEIGYVGKDVEGIIRDLLEVAIKNQKDLKYQKYSKQAEQQTKERILSLLLNKKDANYKQDEKLYDKGAFDDVDIEIDVEPSNNSMNSFDIPLGGGNAVGMIQIGEIISKGMGVKKKKVVKIEEAKSIIFNEIIEELIDNDDTIKEAMQLTEEEGIVFLDEIDKITYSSNSKGGEVSREGVQRDLLPLVEGTIVQTKYGNIKTDHILFIGSGAFYSSKPSDLSPEFQGRFPVRVELQPLTKDDLIQILSTPEASLIKQYQALLKVKGISLEFTQDCIEEVAEIATKLNSEVENIGARRLHTILEKIFYEIMFDDKKMKSKKIVIDKTFISKHLEGISEKVNLSKFIL